MRLYLMRHGNAMRRDNPACPPDPERPLTKKGIYRTRSAAGGLRSLGIFPKVIVSSPYLRAMQTAEIVARVFDLDPNNIVKSDALKPKSEPKSLILELALIQGSAILCTGHATNLDLVIAEILGHSGAPCTKLKKSGVACLEHRRLNATRGHILWLSDAKMLRRMAEFE